jgi:hypothetical protein
MGESKREGLRVNFDRGIVTLTKSSRYSALSWNPNPLKTLGSNLPYRPAFEVIRINVTVPPHLLDFPAAGPFSKNRYRLICECAHAATTRGH